MALVVERNGGEARVAAGTAVELLGCWLVEVGLVVVEIWLAGFTCEAASVVAIRLGGLVRWPVAAHQRDLA